MVVERDDDLELRVVVEVADPDVLSVGAVAVVAGAVEVGIVPRARQGVVPGPGGSGCALRSVGGARGVEHEDLRADPRGVRRRDDGLDPSVLIEIGGRHPASFGTLATAARRRRPAALDPQLTAAELVRGHGSIISADHDLRQLVRIEVGDDAGCIDAPLRRRALAEETPPRIEDERRVERRDDLQAAVAVEVDEPGRREPARLAGLDRPHEARSRHGRGSLGRGASGARQAAHAVDARAAAGRQGDGDEQQGEDHEARHSAIRTR